ncbi:HD domain-containing protein [Chitinophaga rupis]|nr:HD domain-containing protein [Chitinophaga rupis]
MRYLAVFSRVGIMDYNEAESHIGQYVTGFFEFHAKEQFPYHNLLHTQSVVQHAVEIAQSYALGEEELFIIRTAAWFHDIGHLTGGIQDHEVRGVQLMQDYFQQHHLPGASIPFIAGCILATRFPSHPCNFLESVICDADTYHLGTPVFQKTDALVRKEMELRTGRKFPYWYQSTLRFLQAHTFYTDYCRNLLNAGKQENIYWLQSLAKQEG